MTFLTSPSALKCYVLGVSQTLKSCQVISASSDLIIGYHGSLLFNYPLKSSESAKCNSLIITQLKQMLSVVGDFRGGGGPESQYIIR